ncbi:iron hydrogenase small subunit [Clostridium sp. YIM B02505]|uniref:Iron hydrogenase small subunit n=1 Tax=Clostridium yunnanense TaxID=2800325 RepID=A0ABS1ERV1_9CLOT|nr:[FeFe] hydrogenase, group A [Clostridium yunnanense]MBK1812065.1 iron hydrogenase small subunit [Clostridium yunnanense]
MSISKINIDEQLCTGCRRCAEVCPVGAIKGAFGSPQVIDNEICVSCGQCIQICSSYASEFIYGEQILEDKKKSRNMLNSIKEPLFAVYNVGQVAKLKKLLKDKDLYKIVQCAPAVRVSLAEEFGFSFGSLTPGKLSAALKLLSFDRVYDTNFGADLTIMEEGSELIKRISENKNLPMFTSCCPAWVKYAEQEYPELLKHLSSCKSPQQMAGAIIKTYGAKVDNIDSSKILSVAVMPCTCKQFECDREEMNSSGYKDVDIVITTRELAQLIKEENIDFRNLEDREFDSPLGVYTGAGNIFGTTGGVMEAALRTGYELLTKESVPKLEMNFIRGGEGIREANVKVGELELKVAVVSGLKNAKEVLESVKTGQCDYHFVEVMTCPEGCVSGGGQPKILLDKLKKNAIGERKKSLYRHDSELNIRKSHENPYIKKLYEEFLKEPLGKKSHHLLHTRYSSRKREEC